MPSRIIMNEGDLIDLGRLFAQLGYPFTASWVKGRDRTSDQNSLMWLWASECAEQFGDRTLAEVQHEWKLRIGVPILRRDSADFRATYDAILKPLAYPAKLALMEYMPITSEFKVRQMVEFLDTVSRIASEQGVRLTDPDPDLVKYHQRYRAKEPA